MRERDQIAALTIVFGLSLGIVYAVGNPFLWVGWGVVMVGVTGAALVQLNR